MSLTALNVFGSLEYHDIQRAGLSHVQVSYYMVPSHWNCDCDGFQRLSAGRRYDNKCAAEMPSHGVILTLTPRLLTIHLAPELALEPNSAHVWSLLHHIFHMLTAIILRGQSQFAVETSQYTQPRRLHSVFGRPVPWS